MFTITPLFLTVLLLFSLILGIILGAARQAVRVDKIRRGYRKLNAMVEQKYELEKKPLLDKIARLMAERHKGVPSQYRVRVPGTTLDVPLFHPHARFLDVPEPCTIEAVELYDKDDDTKQTVHTVNFDYLRTVSMTAGDELNLSFPLDIGVRLKHKY